VETTVPPTTEAPTTVPPPTITTAPTPSSAAPGNTAPTAATSKPTADNSKQLLRLIIAMLIVVGLLVGTLTWRYWIYTDPRRGLAPSRARLPQPVPGPPPGPPPVASGMELFGAGRQSLPGEAIEPVDPTDPGLGWTPPNREPVP
jgi:hypothetical protein